MRRWFLLVRTRFNVPRGLQATHVPLSNWFHYSQEVGNVLDSVRSPKIACKTTGEDGSNFQMLLSANTPLGAGSRHGG